MEYRVIGLMSGSSLDGLDIVFAALQENGGKWSYEILQAACYDYSQEWIERLRNAPSLTALDYQLLHTEYGHYLGRQVNNFIEENDLYYQVSLIASHGHTAFHLPAKKMTAQLGDGAAIAAETGLPVVSDLRSLDVAFGGQGAPIVPMGEKLLLGEYDFFLNLGGIANISFNHDKYIAFDICPANRVLNLLAQETGKLYDEGGQMAAAGDLHQPLLEQLNQLEYYREAYPKSLANEFGTDVVYPLISQAVLPAASALRTYTEHIAAQTRLAVSNLLKDETLQDKKYKLLVTGGGAFNTFLVERIAEQLKPFNVETIVPNAQLVSYKEALIMALLGVLRWRQAYTVFSSVTGALRDSIGGALWIGQEA
jgi:anhydro-N-acetylmuramic acid kinase